MIAVGSREPINRKTELLSRSNIWSTQAAYPFGRKHFYDYSIVAIKDLFYTFGGATQVPDSSGVTKTIASFSTMTKKWKMCGELKKARGGHGVIVQNGEFVVVGGEHENVFTERCSLKDDTIHCTAVKPKLSNFDFYPEMIAVPHDYCPK